jgi:hypothetical protein
MVSFFGVKNSEWGSGVVQGRREQEIHDQTAVGAVPSLAHADGFESFVTRRKFTVNLSLPTTNFP